MAKHGAEWYEKRVEKELRALDEANERQTAPYLAALTESLRSAGMLDANGEVRESLDSLIEYFTIATHSVDLTERAENAERQWLENSRAEREKYGSGAH